MKASSPNILSIIPGQQLWGFYIKWLISTELGTPLCNSVAMRDNHLEASKICVERNVQNKHIANADRPVQFYNLSRIPIKMPYKKPTKITYKKNWHERKRIIIFV